MLRGRTEKPSLISVATSDPRVSRNRDKLAAGRPCTDEKSPPSKVSPLLNRTMEYPVPSISTCQSKLSLPLSCESPMICAGSVDAERSQKKALVPSLPKHRIPVRG